MGYLEEASENRAHELSGGKEADAKNGMHKESGRQNVLRAAIGSSKKWQYMLGTDIKRKDITTIVFLDTMKGMPANHWDVSEAEDESVAAWAEKSWDGCKLYIAGEGGVSGNPSSRGLFRGCRNLREIRFQGCFDTYQVTDMAVMFQGCSSLTKLDVSGFDTSCVEDMRGMFGGCSALEKLDISGFDTSCVANMKGMFYGCSRLLKLDISGIDTSRVTDMRSMFSGCCVLERLDVSGFDTSRVTDMKSMFSSCCVLERLDVSGFDTSRVTDMESMFALCISLINPDVSGFHTSQVTSMKEMFRFCKGLTYMDISGFDKSSVENEKDMFYGCSAQLKLQKEKAAPYRNMLMADEVKDGGKKKAYMLQTDIQCEKIYTITFLASMAKRPEKYWDVSDKRDGSVAAWAVKNEGGFDFYIAGEGGVAGNKSCRDLFRGCVSLREVRFNNCFDTSKSVDMGYMFWNCKYLKKLDVSSFDTSQVANMQYMFYGCSYLEELNIGSFDTSRVTDMSYMFAGCVRVRMLAVKGFLTSKVQDMKCMFYGCNSLTELDTSGFQMSEAVKKEHMFYGCNSLKKTSTLDSK